MREPLVTVVIPCYRQAEFLATAVESVVAQDVDWWEVIIVDDGSPDDTAAVAARFIQQHGERIRLIRQDNRGVSAARNAGIAAARGSLILPLDADDWIEPATVGLLAEFLGLYPPCTVAYTQYTAFGDREYFEPVAAFDRDLLSRVDIVPYASMFRRTAWDQVGGYREDMAEGYEDWDFWLALSAQGHFFARVGGPLLHYRVSAGSRNEQALGVDAKLRARIRSHHPSLYTRRRRLAAWRAEQRYRGWRTVLVRMRAYQGLRTQAIRVPGARRAYRVVRGSRPPSRG